MPVFQILTNRNDANSVPPYDAYRSASLMINPITL